MRNPSIKVHSLLMAGRAPVYALLLWGITVPRAAAQAQASRTAEAEPARPFPASITIPPDIAQPHQVRWWEAAAVAGTVGALATEDGNIQEETSEHPSEDAGNAASVFRQAGEGKVYAALSLGVLGTGLLIHDRRVTRTGLQLATAGVAAAASFGVLKIVLGRARPDAAQGAYAFHPIHHRRLIPFRAHRDGLRSRHDARRRVPQSLGDRRPLRTGRRDGLVPDLQRSPLAERRRNGCGARHHRGQGGKRAVADLRSSYAAAACWTGRGRGSDDPLTELFGPHRNGRSPHRGCVRAP